MGLNKHKSILALRFVVVMCGGCIENCYYMYESNLLSSPVSSSSEDYLVVCGLASSGPPSHYLLSSLNHKFLSSLLGARRLKSWSWPTKTWLLSRANVPAFFKACLLRFSEFNVKHPFRVVDSTYRTLCTLLVGPAANLTG